VNWFGDSWDAAMNDPTATVEAKVEAMVRIEFGHCRGAVPAVGFHGSRPPISDQRVGRHGAS